MLRLTDSVEIALRKRESRYSNELWKGLGFALTFHVLLFVVFRIATMPSLDTIKPLQPVHVEIDLGLRQASVTISPISIVSFPWDVIGPPTLDTLFAPSFGGVNLMPIMQIKEHHQPDFSDLERIEYTPLPTSILGCHDYY